MQTYSQVLLIAIPFFLGLILIEKLYGVIVKKDTIRIMDMISSISSGSTNITKDVLGLGFVVISYPFLLEHFALVHLESSILLYIIAFVVLDFSGYCTHRIAHRVNIFWNGHIIHHSSEEFNLSTALRQSISGFVNIFTFFLIPAALVGVPHDVISVVAPLHLFAQFWYHTQHIKKMGWLEYIIVTPSHHRVHHAINPVYIDKNYSQIFIFWDKLFGTFQEELDEEPPVYGITVPARTWNPIKINFQHLFLLIQDAIRTDSMRDKIRIWFMPTGWRPEDVKEKYPIQKIENVFQQEKYNPTQQRGLMYWTFFQFLGTIFFILYFFSCIGSINIIQMYGYGLFIFLHIYAYTELMDDKKDAILFEILKSMYGLFLFYYYDSWFGLFAISNIAAMSVLFYFIISPIFVLYFYFQLHQKEWSIQKQSML
ncbi:MAG: sterol desaturase family protein [Chitinophagaceae bacterium]|nr:sterol desaturase family protein [Chitinophagaceae bacterium]